MTELTELEFNKQYHIAYILGTEFEKRMCDIYVGMNTIKRPPYLTDIFSETAQMQALLLLERGIGDYQVLERHEEELRERVWNNDPSAIEEVLGWEADHAVYRNIYFDMCMFFDRNHMSLIGQKGLGDIEMIHSPVMDVW